MTTKPQAAKRQALNVRIRPEDRSLIDRAAHLLGKSRTDFLLEAGRRAAEDAVLDQTLFKVSPEVYADFLARLDARTAPNDRLRRTMSAPAPWK